ncbi:MAG: SNF2-related protein [Gammaproteobacteria bacterium]
MDSLQLHRLLAEGEWRSEFDDRALERGVRYARERRVLSLSHETLDPRTETLTGAVHGSRAQPYLTAIELRTTRGGLTLRAQCNCPVLYRCKHAAALLAVASVAAPDAWPSVGGASPPELSIPATSRAKSDEATRKAHLDAWDRWLENLQATASNSALEAAPERRFGILIRGERGEPSTLLATPAWMRPGKTRGGGLVDPQPLHLNTETGPVPMPPGGWPPALAGALAVLLQNRYVHTAGKYWTRIQAGYQEQALEALLKQYPVYFEKGAVPLEAGKPLALEVYWREERDGSQRLAAHVQGHTDAWLLRGATLWYVLPNKRRYGHVEGDPNLLEQVRTAPPVLPEEVPALRKRLARRRTSLDIPPPAARAPVEVIEARPKAVLILRVVHARRLSRRWTQTALACATLAFDYAGHRLAPADYETVTRRLAAGRVFEFRRDQDAEDAVLESLEAAGLVDAGLFVLEHATLGIKPGAHDFFLRPERHKPPLAPEEARPLIEALEADGIRIEYEAGFPHDKLVDIERWHAELASGSDNAWFEVMLGIEIRGERVDLLPILRRMITDPAFPLTPEAGEKPDAVWRLNIDAARSVEIPLARLRALIAPLLEWIEGGEKTLRVHASQAPALREAAVGAQLTWHDGDRLQKRLTALRDAPHSKQAPRGFRTTLRAYQREGLAWLDYLAAAGLGGILADDMGLGKTVQVLAHILGEKQRGGLGHPVLVVAPTSLIGNWRAEAARFAPDLRVLVIHGAERAGRYAEIGAQNLVITTYPLLPRDRERLLEHDFSLLVLDEAQAIKNTRSQAAQVVRELRAARRIAMTGTPLENHLGELWAQFDAIEPGLLGSERRFTRLYRTPIEKHGDAERRERLKRRIAPLILRRRKDDVLTELPPKTEILRTLELDKGQRELYESLRLAQHKRVRQAIRQRGLAQSGIIVLDALLKLRQVCCDPRLVKLASARKVHRSAKLDALLELLDGLLDEGRRVLLFSQFTEMLALIEAALQKRKIEYLLLTGQTPGAARTDLIARFQAGVAPVFLVSLKAGGVGLNLTAADAVIHYDPWWNPAVEAQATGRAHRIGQDKPVFVYKLLCAGTVEEKIHALQARKADLARAVLEGEGSAKLHFEESDLDELFAPL